MAGGLVDGSFFESCRQNKNGEDYFLSRAHALILLKGK